MILVVLSEEQLFGGRISVSEFAEKAQFSEPTIRLWRIKLVLLLRLPLDPAAVSVLQTSCVAILHPSNL